MKRKSKKGQLEELLKLVMILIILGMGIIIVWSIMGRAGGVLSGLMSIRKIDSSANGGDLICSGKEVVVGAQNYIKASDYLDMLYCMRMEDIVVTIDNTYDTGCGVAFDDEACHMDSLVNDGDLFCPDGRIVCGAKNHRQHNTMLDEIWCCPAKGILVDMDTIELIDGTEKGEAIFCPEGKIVCGAKNHPNRDDRLDKIYCCEYEIGKIDLSAYIEIYKGSQKAANAKKGDVLTIKARFSNCNDCLPLKDIDVRIYVSEFAHDSSVGGYFLPTYWSEDLYTDKIDLGSGETREISISWTMPTALQGSFSGNVETREYRFYARIDENNKIFEENENNNRDYAYVVEYNYEN